MLSETAEMLASAQSLCQRYGACVGLSWGAAILADPVGVTDILGAGVCVTVLQRDGDTGPDGGREGPAFSLTEEFGHVPH
jgi:hypothetical protein